MPGAGKYCLPEQLGLKGLTFPQHIVSILATGDITVGDVL